MLFSLSTPALAASTYTAKTEKAILSIAEAKMMNLTLTNTDSVYKTSNGKYFAQTDENYIAVSKIDIPFSSPDIVQSVLTCDEYSPHLKESIQKYYDYANHENMTDEITMTLFSSGGFIIDDEGDYNHGGKEMRYQVLDYGEASTKTIEINSGRDTYSMADTAISVLITGASAVVLGRSLSGVPVDTRIATSIDGVSIAKSMLDIIKSLNPNKTITGTTSDFSEINFHYRYLEKYITVNTDTIGWTDALTTCRAEIDYGTLRVCLYDADTLKMYDKNFTVNSFVAQGENYESPWQAAYDHMFFSLYEPVSLKVDKSTTLKFGDFIW